MAGRAREAESVGHDNETLEAGIDGIGAEPAVCPLRRCPNANRPATPADPVGNPPTAVVVRREGSRSTRLPLGTLGLWNDTGTLSGRRLRAPACGGSSAQVQRLMSLGLLTPSLVGRAKP